MASPLLYLFSVTNTSFSCGILLAHWIVVFLRAAKLALCPSHSTHAVPAWSHSLLWFPLSSIYWGLPSNHIPSPTPVLCFQPAKTSPLGSLTQTSPILNSNSLPLTFFLEFQLQIQWNTFECLAYANNCARPSDSHLQGVCDHVAMQRGKCNNRGGQETADSMKGIWRHQTTET